MSENVGVYTPNDIRIVAAIDIDRRKIGQTLKKRSLQNQTAPPVFTKMCLMVLLLVWEKY
jgi:myo-inositol-1-phosphate synthase